MIDLEKPSLVPVDIRETAHQVVNTSISAAEMQRAFKLATQASGSPADWIYVPGYGIAAVASEEAQAYLRTLTSSK